MIEVRIPTLLRQMYGVPPAVQVEAATAVAAILALDRQWPGLSDRILEPEGSLRPYLLIFVNEEPAGPDTTLAPGARVRVVTSVAGG